jgi:hypothetical protein
MVPDMRAGLEAHLGSRQVAGVVYGAIIGLALVVALESHPPGPGFMVGWLLGTAVAVGLAELYSEVVGAETSTRHRVTHPDFMHMLEDALAVAFGVAFPAVFFLLALLGLLAVESAFTLAKWTGLGLIGFYGFWAARFAGTPTSRALLQALLVALVGAALIALKALLH